MKESKVITDMLERTKSALNTLFKPEFYRLTDESAKEKFLNLLSIPGLCLHDTIKEQLAELIKYRNPSRKFSNEELSQGVLEFFNGRPIEDYGVWVFYPWSNRLVHLLDEKEFIEVRTSRNQYKITPDERDVLQKKKIGIIGLSVGQSVAVTLAMERICGELRLADFDLLELTNLNRIRTGVHNLGIAKVYSVAREIAEIDPFLTVRCFPEGINDNTMDAFFTEGGKLDLMIEESDGFDIKILSRYKARELKIPVLMEASDRCMVDVERFDLEPARSILHGLVDHLDIKTLKSLRTTEEKIPYMLDVLGIDTASPRLKASMLEIEQTINTWPQLASAVTMGGGITADVARRLLLGYFKDSGRYFVDVEELIGNKLVKVQKQQEITLETNNPELLKDLVNGTPQVLEDAEIEKLVEAACLAPSLGNSQPWKWYQNEGDLYLTVDSDRLLKSSDPENTYLYLACGAAIENLCLEANNTSIKGKVQSFPLKSNPDLIARLQFEREVAKQESALASYIPLRHTNRAFANSKPVTEQELESLIHSFRNAANSDLSFIQDKSTIHALAGIYGRSERLRLLDVCLNTEYFENELQTAKFSSQKTGYPLSQLHAPVAMQYATAVFQDRRVGEHIMDWGKGQSLEKYHERVFDSTPAIGIVQIQNKSPESLLQLGRSIQRLWLEAQALGLSFHPVCLPSIIPVLFRLNANNNKHWPENIFCLHERLTHDIDTIFTKLGKPVPVFMFRIFNSDNPVKKTTRLDLKSVFKNLNKK